MNEPEKDDKAPVKPGDDASTKGAEANTPNAGGQPPANQLSKEEQWALFEEDLKESDWGHQPC